tara:strand:- start:209 stop:622 length:414 start_codon:yes stop_codon:yes gene_type:complete
MLFEIGTESIPEWLIYAEKELQKTTNTYIKEELKFTEEVNAFLKISKCNNYKKIYKTDLIYCECGGQYQSYNKKKHVTSKKHCIWAGNFNQDEYNKTKEFFYCKCSAKILFHNRIQHFNTKKHLDYELKRMACRECN